MKCTKLLLLFTLIFLNTLYAQVGINTENPNPSAALEIKAGNNPKGVLIPRVNLTSIEDIVTIANPAKDLIVYNLSNAGSGVNQLFADHLYKFNGTIWKRFSAREELINNNPDLPYVVAFGRKTTIDDCNLTTPDEAVFNLNILSNSNIISSKGEFIAPKDGYYSFAAMANIKILGAPGQSFEQSPYIYAEGLTTYVFKFRGSAVQDNPRTIVGVVYLEEGQITKPFYWNKGGLICNATTTTSKIKEQQVVWEYIGNP